MRTVLWRPSIFRIFVLCILFIVPLFLYSEEDLTENKWIQEGNILLESKQFEEAESLANSILGSDPSNSKAEFLLTQAWIGMGKEERKKGNFQKAKEYLEKAYKKWPLNESIRTELTELENSPILHKKSPIQYKGSFFDSNVSNKSMENLILSVDLLRLEIEKLKTELETERKEHTKENRWTWIYLFLGIQITILFLVLQKIRKL
ncbi:tetratricopeptide repeat protein [Leptospira neocaledonica]|uniref:Uncharacterized protein n=1 Tax=Leptospira neocaledonica TaxID=2023192 RepID=A0A2M9ZYJ8_9LEPT|nr:hypothetical protein [Leptospira neocaledonica]PJZ77125.1 hypothetical protein CH365_10245 [Leptospira neocaledonica]